MIPTVHGHLYMVLDCDRAVYFSRPRERVQSYLPGLALASYAAHIRNGCKAISLSRLTSCVSRIRVGSLRCGMLWRESGKATYCTTLLV